MDRDLGYLAGYWIGDGSWSLHRDRDRLVLYGSLEALPRLESVMARLNLPFKPIAPPSRPSLWASYLYELPPSLGLDFRRHSWTKELPFQPSSDLFKIGLIEGLWDTDGTASHSQGKSFQHHLTYSTTSEILADQLETLLSSISIQATVRKVYPRKGRPAYYVRVTSRGVHQFHTLIRLIPRKQEGLQFIVDNVKQRLPKGVYPYRDRYKVVYKGKYLGLVDTVEEGLELCS